MNRKKSVPRPPADGDPAIGAPPAREGPGKAPGWAPDGLTPRQLPDGGPRPGGPPGAPPAEGFPGTGAWPEAGTAALDAARQSGRSALKADKDARRAAYLAEQLEYLPESPIGRHKARQIQRELDELTPTLAEVKPTLDAAAGRGQCPPKGPGQGPIRAAWMVATHERLKARGEPNATSKVAALAGVDASYVRRVVSKATRPKEALRPATNPLPKPAGKKKISSVFDLASKPKDIR